MNLRRRIRFIALAWFILMSPLTASEHSTADAIRCGTRSAIPALADAVILTQRLSGVNAAYKAFECSAPKVQFIDNAQLTKLINQSHIDPLRKHALLTKIAFTLAGRYPVYINLDQVKLLLHMFHGDNRVIGLLASTLLHETRHADGDQDEIRVLRFERTVRVTLVQLDVLTQADVEQIDAEIRQLRPYSNLSLENRSLAY